jgi:hypothetical protein
MARQILSCEARAIDRAGEIIFARRFELDVLQARNDRRPAVGSSGTLLDASNLSLDFAVILDGSKMDHLDGEGRSYGCSGRC